ncbi:universal stress protein [Methanoculleus chikugoensis]|nr:universal stress protein [Methanoculleus chikugoensis]
MMYQQVFVGVDGSPCSDLAVDAALAFASAAGTGRCTGCHVYAARMHRQRFEDMEPGLPERYREEERLGPLRATHDDLISGGMALISDAYLAPPAAKAAARGVPFEPVTAEGRGYVEFLRLIRERRPDLTVLGATGHGQTPEIPLGSLAERVLLYAREGDLLLVRRPWNLKNRPVVVGVDGSDASYAALHRAATIAAAFDAPLEAVAVYDPFFHAGVFPVIADALPEDAQRRFNFPAQERLHDEIIDRGLEHLYRRNLERGAALARTLGARVHTAVVAGRVCPQVHHYAAARGAGLLVLGRYGLHREEASLVGSNALNLARMSTTNVLVVAPPAGPIAVPDLPIDAIPWTPEAEALLSRVPPFARGAARTAIEEHARARGLSRITESAVQDAARRFGMGGG